MILDILYRGYLESCNYDCGYCPFAKQADTLDVQAKDKQAVQDFVNWISKRPENIRLLFTPWGEALTRRWYKDALIKISHLPLIKQVSIQTNGAWNSDWIKEANNSTLKLWITYHPDQTKLQTFLHRCEQLIQQGFDFSVGCVGLTENFKHIKALRNQLNTRIPVWVNAYHDGGIGYYSNDDIQFLIGIDPTFKQNLNRHVSINRICRSGSRAFSIVGNGDIRRCHFVKTVIGSIYDKTWSPPKIAAPCPNAECNCYIGYAHLEELESVYGNNIWSRIPLPNTIAQ